MGEKLSCKARRVWTSGQVQVVNSYYVILVTAQYVYNAARVTLLRCLIMSPRPKPTSRLVNVKDGYYKTAR